MHKYLLWTLIILVLTLYLLYALIRKAAMNSVLKPWKDPRHLANTQKVKEFVMPISDDGTDHVTVYMVFPSEMRHQDKLVVFLPGSSYNAGYYMTQCKAIADAMGILVCTLEYPGYGKSTGTPSKANIYMASKQMVVYMSTALKIPMQDVMLYGYSLGTHVATWLATQIKGIHTVVLDACVPVIANSAAREVQPQIFAPIVRYVLSGYFDIRDDLHILRSTEHGHQVRIIGIHRQYDYLTSMEEFRQVVLPYCTDALIVRAGHAWPIVNSQVIKRISIGFSRHNRIENLKT